MRVASSDIGLTSSNLDIMSLKPWVTSSYPRATNLNSGVTSSKAQNARKKHDLGDKTTSWTNEIMN